MPFIKYTEAADKVAGRGPKAQRHRSSQKGSPAVTVASYRAWLKAAKQRVDKWVPVRSSWVEAVKFNSRRGTFDMRVKKGGKEYPDYPDMNREKFRNLLKIRSVGKWMWRYYPPRRHGGRS